MSALHLKMDHSGTTNFYSLKSTAVPTLIQNASKLMNMISQIHHIPMTDSTTTMSTSTKQNDALKFHKNIHSLQR